MRIGIGLVVALLGGAVLAAAEEDPARSPEVTVRLKDGNQIVGRVVTEDDEAVEVATKSGASVRLPRASIVSIRPAWTAGLEDPNDSRLFFAPSGRPMHKGEATFSDHLFLFPGVSFGLTDNVTLMGGVSAIPGVGLDEQLLYGAVKVGARFSDSAAASVGYFYVRAGAEEIDNGAGVGFGMVTLGRPEKSLTAGLGIAHADSDTQPIALVGGQVRVSKRLFLLSENWLILGDEFDLANQPFSLGLRFCGDRLSVDFGAILVGEIIDEGFPIPWLSFSYKFRSPSRNGESSAARMGPRT